MLYSNASAASQDGCFRYDIALSTLAGSKDRWMAAKCLAVCSREEVNMANQPHLVVGVNSGKACRVFGKLGANISGAGVDGLQRLPKLLHVRPH